MEEFLYFILANLASIAFVISLLSFYHLMKSRQKGENTAFRNYVLPGMLFLLIYAIFFISLFHYFPSSLHFLLSLQETRNMWASVHDGLFVFIGNHLFFSISGALYLIIALLCAFVVEKDSFPKRVLWIISPIILILLEFGVDFLRSFDGAGFIIVVTSLATIGLAVSCTLAKMLCVGMNGNNSRSDNEA